jgi:AcrR family transcriptional regulator
MEQLLQKIKVDINENLYLKDPFSSDLGKEIIAKSIKCIREHGLENFNFKKLATEVGSTEAAIYRYFENKHKLMLFLNLWYWGFLELNLVMGTTNLVDPQEKLQVAIKILVNGPLSKKNDFVDPVTLHDMIVEEAIKAFMTKEVDEDRRKGFFTTYLNMGERIAEILKEINPAYNYPKTLVSMIMEASLLQRFHAKHFPTLIEAQASEEERLAFFNELITKAIN